jgi:hypothetical protein
VARERAEQERSVSVDTEYEVLREQALADLDALIEISEQARREIRSYRSALEESRRHLVRGERARDMIGLFDVSAVRTSFTDRLNSIERARSISRRSLWRLQVFEGMTIAEIARAWGFSRQLVSRALSLRDDARAETS